MGPAGGVTRVGIRRRGDEAVLRFEYDRDVVEAVKGLPERRFDPTAKEWVVPVQYYLDAAVAVESVGAEVDLGPQLQDLAERGETPSAPRPTVSVRRSGAQYVVRFGYRPDLVQAIKGIPGRTFDPSAKAWFVPAEAPETLEFIVDAMEAAGARVEVEGVPASPPE